MFILHTHRMTLSVEAPASWVDVFLSFLSWLFVQLKLESQKFQLVMFELLTVYVNS